LGEKRLPLFKNLLSASTAGPRGVGGVPRGLSGPPEGIRATAGEKVRGWVFEAGLAPGRHSRVKRDKER